MDADLKRRWVEALRSGEYRQGRMALQSGGEYCCIGVLCDVYDDSKWVDPPAHYRGEDRRAYGTTANVGNLQVGGLDAAMGIDFEVEGGHVLDVLADLNDYGGASFTQIADWIEENVPAEPSA